MAQKNYGLDAVNVTFNGVLIQEGLKSVSVSNVSDAFTWDVGAGGEVVSIRSVDNRALVTVTLMGTASVNLALSALHNADKITPNGTGVGILYVEQGNDKFVSAKTRIQKAPDREFGIDSIGDVEWVFMCADLVRVDAGN